MENGTRRIFVPCCQARQLSGRRMNIRQIKASTEEPRESSEVGDLKIASLLNKMTSIIPLLTRRYQWNVKIGTVQSIPKSQFICMLSSNFANYDFHYNSLYFSLFLFLFSLFSAFEADKRVLSDIDYGVKYSFKRDTIKLNNMYFVINLLYTSHTKICITICRLINLLKEHCAYICVFCK